MQTLSVYPTDPRVLQLSSWYVVSGGQCTQGPVEATGVREFRVDGIPHNATVYRAILEVEVSGYAYGTNKQYCLANETEVSSANGQNKTNYVRMSVSSNRRVDVPFRFKVNVITLQENKTYHFLANFENMVLKIYYSTEEEDAEPDPPMELAPAKTINVYKPDETDFSHNGLAVLNPSKCIVSEEAGGSYELEMDYPIDEYGKWELLQEGCIIKAPIPPTYIPETSMPPWSLWMTNKATTMYSTLPTYTKINPSVETASTWNKDKNYQAGVLVVRKEKQGPKSFLYLAEYANSNTDPIPEAERLHVWERVGEVGTENNSVKVVNGHGQFKPGVEIGTLQSGELVYKVADFNATWMKVRSLLGRVGYVKKADCTYQEAEESLKLEARTLYTQLFRIYTVTADESLRTISVQARHISYDLQKNCLFDCQLEDCEPSTAIANIQCAMVNYDERTIMCDITSPTIRADWSFQNPLQAILDPEQGLAGQLHAKVIRDNADIFLLDGTKLRRGPTLTYGCNLIGISWSRSTDNVVTRVIPRAKDNNDYIYLEELYIDSRNIDKYPVIYTEVLDSAYSVGQEVTRPGGTKYKLDRASVIEKMREEAEDRFFVDRCDAETVTLEVEFVLLGDTDEYKQYRNLQRLNLYDRITVISGPTGMRTDAQVTGYEWNCVTGQYKSIKLGKLYSQSRNKLPGFRVGTGAITYKNLAPTLVDKIRGS